MFAFYPGSKEAFLGPNAAQPVNNMPHNQPGFTAPMPAWLKDFKMPQAPQATDPLAQQREAMLARNKQNELLAQMLEQGGTTAQPMAPRTR